MMSLMWDLKEKIQMNLFLKQKEIHRPRKRVNGYQSEEGGVVSDKLGVWD